MMIETRSLVVGYGPASHSHIPDFSLDRGDFACVTGSNGSGKTTLLKTIAGLLDPLAGEVVRHIERGGIGYLPQRGPLEKDFPATVLEVVRSGCQASRGLRPFYTFSERRRAERIMERLGIAHLASRSYRELSGGQRQRVLIARTFVIPRTLLLLDEPTVALDKAATENFVELLGELNSKGASVLMVTHDETLAAKAKIRISPETCVKEVSDV